MIYLKKLGLILFMLLASNSIGQTSSLWEDFKKASKHGSEPILPDFSYAGYKHSEVPIPDVDFKIFNVIDFGAKPNDKKSDKKAIIKAIRKAKANGNGVIYFPSGKYIINGKKDDLETFYISGSNIVFRGAKDQSSTLFFEKDLPPKNPKQFWSCPYAIQTKPKGNDKYLTDVVSMVRRETKKIAIKNSSGIKAGDWIVLSLLNNDPELIKYEIQPLKLEQKWTSLIEKGVHLSLKHQVESVAGNNIILKEPIHYDINPKHGWKVFSFNHLEHIGFENLVFEGNWTKEFKHHESAQGDGGWSILKLSGVVNSWVRNCVFINVNRALSIPSSAATTVLNVSVEGNKGHNCIQAGHKSTGILLAKVDNKAGMHHSTGVEGNATGTVIWRSKHTPNTSFESHASQPRCTLFDNIKGGFQAGRAGGAKKNLPNHGRYLVLWNYEETGELEENFDFVSKNNEWMRIVPPIIVGFHGVGTTFNTDEVQVLESLGTPVNPESLFEEQLKLRLGKLPSWIKEEKSK